MGTASDPIDDRSHPLVGDCRELIHEWHEADQYANVMELRSIAR